MTTCMFRHSWYVFVVILLCVCRWAGALALACLMIRWCRYCVVESLGCRSLFRCRYSSHAVCFVLYCSLSHRTLDKRRLKETVGSQDAVSSRTRWVMSLSLSSCLRQDLSSGTTLSCGVISRGGEGFIDSMIGALDDDLVDMVSYAVRANVISHCKKVML